MQHLKTLNEIYLYEDIAKQIHAYSASSLGSYLSHLIVLRNNKKTWKINIFFK